MVHHSASNLLLQVLDLLVDYLKLVAEFELPQSDWTHNLAVRMYEVLEYYLFGDSDINALYLSKYVQFFTAQFTKEVFSMFYVRLVFSKKQLLIEGCFNDKAVNALTS